MPGGGPGGSSSSEVVYAGATEITSASAQDGKSYTSSAADQSALMISTSDDVTVTGFTLSKSGDSDGGDNCNFYGQNAALLVKGGTTTTISGGTYTSNGLGSPAIYSTADITASNATLVSNLSEGVCIEGLNSITLNNCNLTANNTKCNGNATFLDSIMIYQSMSGDAASGTSSFNMTGGSLTSKSGHVFHVTNTNAKGDTVSTEVGTVSVTLDSTSTWTLTGDSYVASFTGSASNVISNGYTLYVNGTALAGTK
ncbi:MAG: hypothetical protein IJL87_00295 [Clostridia bacterium]|nr:hypothetical protein [Clostridia bacterium]